MALDDLAEEDLDLGLPWLHGGCTHSCACAPLVAFGFDSTGTLWCSRSLSARKHEGRKQGVIRLRKIGSLIGESE